MFDEAMNDELAAVEAALSRLTPIDSAVHRDRLMFLAGRASAEAQGTRRRGRSAAWWWPSVAGVSWIAAAVFALLWAGDGATRIAERAAPVRPPDASSSVVATADATDASVGPLSPWSNAPLLRLWSEQGADAWPLPRMDFGVAAPAEPPLRNDPQSLAAMLRS